MDSSAAEKIEQLDRLMESVEEDQTERKRLKRQVDASLDEFHRITRELKEAEPGGEAEPEQDQPAKDQPAKDQPA
jgi:hypothetical protein